MLYSSRRHKGRLPGQYIKTHFSLVASRLYQHLVCRRPQELSITGCATRLSSLGYLELHHWPTNRGSLCFPLRHYRNLPNKTRPPFPALEFLIQHLYLLIPASVAESVTVLIWAMLIDKPQNTIVPLLTTFIPRLPPLAHLPPCHRFLQPYSLNLAVHDRIISRGTRKRTE